MKQKGLNSLYDISDWNNSTGSWKGWLIENLPVHLEKQVELFLLELKGATPINLFLEDRRMWKTNTTIYSVKEGYAALNNIPPHPPVANIWKQIW
eukprot:Gb_03439 [translate_table: standard]